MSTHDEEFIERRIITGLIVSKEYVERIHRFWNPMLLESPEFRKVANWCIEYYEQYKTVPDQDIESIYMQKLKEGSVHKSEGQYIEEVLNDLSEEYGRGTAFNSGYLYDQTVRYFKSQELERHNEEVQILTEAGRIEEAEHLVRSYKSAIMNDTEIGIDLSSRAVLHQIDLAFSESAQKVLSYPGALGDMINDHLIRGGFVSFLAPEKRGKTFMMLDMSLRAIRQKAHVAFFQAGDMTQEQQLVRICTYLTRRSSKEKYCCPYYKPVGDCIFNQLDICQRPDRNCDHGIFEEVSLDEFKANKDKYVTQEILKEKLEEFPDYKPCDSHTCDKRQGTVWIEFVDAKKPLTALDAKKAIRKFFKKHKRKFKLVTHASDTLTVDEMDRCLDEWERYDGFVPDVILVDYADLMVPDKSVNEFRHRQDQIWKGLRGLSQRRHCLLITATQADADSYNKGRLALSNFSEDKRKYAHVTAMYGMNQDPQGREKRLGILRLNEMVVREGEFSNDNEVTILQDLRSGRPVLESYK